MLTEVPGPLSSQSSIVMGLSGQAKCYYLSSFKLELGLSAVSSRVSDPARVSLTLSGDGYTGQGPGFRFHEYGV